MASYWLMKSEPDTFSFDDLKKEPRKTACWDGVRNYQARNFMQEMQVGDGILYYHSNTKVPGVVGTATVAKLAYPDHTQFEEKSKYYDPKSDPANPRWYMVDIKYDKPFKQIVPLQLLREQKALEGMRLLRKGNRLSVMPVSAPHWRKILKLGGL